MNGSTLPTSSSVLSVITTTSLRSFNCSRSFCTNGNSARHGPHHVAQKLMNAHLAFKIRMRPFATFEICQFNLRQRRVLAVPGCDFSSRRLRFRSVVASEISFPAFARTAELFPQTLRVKVQL